MNLETFKKQLDILKIKHTKEIEILQRQYINSITRHRVGDTINYYNNNQIKITKVGYRCNNRSGYLPEPIYYGNNQDGIGQKIYHSELIK